METMTTKQLAETAGVTVHGIRKVAKELYPHKMVHGKQSKWNQEESNAIMRKIQKKNMVGQQVTQLPVTGNAVTSPITADLLTQAIGQALAPILEGMNQRISRLEEKAEEVQPLLPPPVNPRKEISRVIRNHVNAQGTGDYGRCFRELYTEYKYRTGIDLVQRAKNRGVDALDYAEAEDLIGQVVSLAREMYP